MGEFASQMIVVTGAAGGIGRAMARCFVDAGMKVVLAGVNEERIKEAVREFEDTQCGFKCFHRSVVDDLFSHQTIDGFGFDVELLYVAQKRGYNIVEVPIQWYHQTESKVEPIRDTLRMVQDMIMVRRNDQSGVYD